MNLSDRGPVDRSEDGDARREGRISPRYEKGSIILTSNKHVRDWPNWPRKDIRLVRDGKVVRQSLDMATEVGASASSRETRSWWASVDGSVGTCLL